MRLGTIDLIILIAIFLGIQLWWIIPIIINNNKIDNGEKDFIEEIKKLERIYKK